MSGVQRSARIPWPIFSRETLAPLFRDADIAPTRAGFPEFAFMISFQLAIFGRERKGQSRQGRASEGGRFCRFVTLQCINERTFIKAETVFSAVTNCRLARACPHRSTSSIFHPLFPGTSGGGMFFRGMQHSWATLYYRYTEFYINSRLFFSIL